MNATNVTVGAIVTATVENGPALNGDWVAVYTVGGSMYLDWKYLNGAQVAPGTGLTDAVVPFVMPMTAGTYTLKFFSGSTLLATSAPITVNAASLSMSAASVTGGGSVTATVSNGPGRVGDWLGVYGSDGATLFTWKYLNGAQTLPVSGITAAAVDLSMPSTQGTYSVRLYSNSTVLASKVVTVSAAAPPSVTPSATAVTIGVVVTATVANGPAQTGDWIELAAVSGPYYMDWRYLNGTQTAPATGVAGAAIPFTMPMAPGTYVMRFYSGAALLATSAPITVSMPATTLTASTTSVAVGCTVTATLVNGPGGRTDWIAVYPEGSSTYVDWKYLNGTQTAPATGMTGAVIPFTMPMTPGNYILRFYTGSTLIASSAVVTVSNGSSIVVDSTNIAPGGSVTATVTNGPGLAGDWVALFSSNSSSFIEWKYLNNTQALPATGMTGGTVTFAIPTVQGTYSIKLFNASQNLLTVSPTITAAFGATMTVSATTVAAGDSVTATIANGPGLARDWIGLYSSNGATLLNWKYLNGSQTVPAQGSTNAAVSMPMPTTPGSYRLRFVSGSTILVTSPVVTVQ